MEYRIVPQADYWTPQGGSNVWESADNWTKADGTHAVPGVSDVAEIGLTGHPDANVTLASSPTIQGLELGSGYTHELRINDTEVLTVEYNNGFTFNINGGLLTLVGSNSKLILSSNSAVTGTWTDTQVLETIPKLLLAV